MDTGLAALLGDVDRLRRGNGDDGEVDLSGDIADARVGLQPEHLVGLGVDRVDRPGEAGAQDIRQDVVADPSGERLAPMTAIDEG